MTVLDTSAAVDFLLGGGVVRQVEALMTAENELAAPELMIFEALAVLRREAHRGEIDDSRAGGAVKDLGDLPVELFPCLPLRQRAWMLRANFTPADALFLALAEQLDEPLATKDGALAAEAAKHTNVTVLAL